MDSIKERNVLIEAKSISKEFKKSKTSLQIIKNLDLKIYEGDFTVIMGRSGAGKSTLLYCISAMDDITGGEVLLNNKNISNISEKEMSKVRTNYMSFIFQSFNLFNDLTLFDNVAYIGYRANNKKKEVNEKVDDILKKLDIYDAKDKYPNEVSGGMKQRAAIARALINDSKIIFGDEPTGALNSSAGESVLNILTELNNKNKTMVIVTHDVKVAARGTRLVYLKDGKIDGELTLGKTDKNDFREREKEVIKFLNERGW